MKFQNMIIYSTVQRVANANPHHRLSKRNRKK